MHRAERYKGGEEGRDGESRGEQGRGEQGRAGEGRGGEGGTDRWLEQGQLVSKIILCSVPRWHRMSYEVLEARTLLAPPERSITPTPALTCNPPSFPSNRFMSYSLLLPERNVYQLQ